jgi:hypothetical protein
MAACFAQEHDHVRQTVLDHRDGLTISEGLYGAYRLAARVTQRSTDARTRRSET